jgi:Amt family ammonium transporter
MAVSAGIIVANIYYNQPILKEIAGEFKATETQVGMISMLTQIGYGLGLFFITPLGDKINKKKLIIGLQVLLFSTLFLIIFTANVLQVWALSLMIGLLSGMIVDLSSYLLDKTGIDDAVGAVPVHLFGGMAGTLLLPFFMKAELLHTGDRTSQFLVQLLGLFVNFCWAFGVSFIMFKIIDKTLGLRVTAEEEEKGLNIVEFSDIYSWEKYMEISGYEREIKDKNELLRKQARLLAVTEEQEKEKLARDLHDGVGQSLAALKLILGMTKKNLESAKDHRDREKLLQNTEKAVTLTENSMSEIRNVLNNLKPEPLAENGLPGGLSAMAEGINQTGTLSCTLRIVKPIPHFDETVTLNIYRVIQEAITNVVKHANAGKVDIIAGAGNKSGRYDFQIVDDGIGFSPENSFHGVGIPSMADRVSMLGGTFTIDSGAGKGTRIIVEVPTEDE